MDEVKAMDFEMKPQTNYVLWLAIFVSLVLGFRIFTSPEVLQMTYTQEEKDKVASAEEILREGLSFTSESEIISYLDSIELGFKKDTPCSEHPKSFSSQQDMFGYHNYQLSLMKSIDGSGACVTYSGFPISEVASAEGISEELKKSVVIVRAGSSSGTGFILSDKTVFTNFHVASDYDDKPHSSFKIETSDGTTYSAKYVSGSLTSDTAILETTRSIANTVPVKLSEQPLAYGEPVIAIGHPSGVGSWIASVGIYYGERNNIFDVPGPRFSLPSAPGISGSPIFNLRGELVAAVYGSNDISKDKARTSEEARYQVPLHKAIVSSYSILAGISLENIMKEAGLTGIDEVEEAR